MSSDDRLRILAISGSLRKASYTTAVLRAVPELAPPEFDMTLKLLHDIPMFDQDLLDEKGCPPSVLRLREEVVAADGIVMALPEYNHSVPAVLKNATEWMNVKPRVIAEKPVALFSTSPSPYGGTRAQYHLRQVLQALGAHALSLPEVAVANVDEKVENGRLVDEATRTALSAQMAAFRDWILRLRLGVPVTAR
jgi:chromate reductase